MATIIGTTCSQLKSHRLNASLVTVQLFRPFRRRCQGRQSYKFQKTVLVSSRTRSSHVFPPSYRRVLDSEFAVTNWSQIIDCAHSTYFEHAAFLYCNHSCSVMSFYGYASLINASTVSHNYCISSDTSHIYSIHHSNILVGRDRRRQVAMP